MFARTPRLLLRPGFPEDAPALAAAIADQAIARNLANVPWPYSMRDAEAFLATLDRAESVKVMGDVMRATYPPDRDPDPSV